MVFEVFTKIYKDGGVSSEIREVEFARPNREKEYGRFTAYYRYAESKKEAEIIQFHNKGGREWKH